MANYFEALIGAAHSETPFRIGKKAAEEALLQVRKLPPRFAITFISPELDVFEVNRGLLEVLKGLPLIGTSTAGEINNGYKKNSVVVILFCSHHIDVKLGIGEGVSSDCEKAITNALVNAGVYEYFTPKSAINQMLKVHAPSMAGMSPVLLIVFSPGVTKKGYSFTHDIHSYLRKRSSNRIPIFGGSSADYFKYARSYQLVNDHISNDAVAVAFLETDVLFGLGMSHGFSPTTKRALVTKASGHLVHEFDGRPASDVYAEMLGITASQIKANLPAPPSPLNEFPLGSIDVYGNSLLLVPEHILSDGSIQFPHLIGNDRVMTLMKADRHEIVKAGVSAYDKAVRYGGLTRPSVVVMLSCALRLTQQEEQEEIDLVRKRTNVPVCGFYTYGEMGIFDDGLPVYNNQSVSILVFSDELNPVASLMHHSKKVYQEFTSQVEKKISQIKSISRINQIIQATANEVDLISAITKELPVLFPWANGSFYDGGYKTATTVDEVSRFGHDFKDGVMLDSDPHCISVNLFSHGKHFGVLVLKPKNGEEAPEEEERVLAEIVGNLVASGLYRIRLDRSLSLKMKQVEILNQLGSEFAKRINPNVQSQNIVRHVCRILGATFATLWLVDLAHHFWVKEALDAAPDFHPGLIETENDEKVVKWQVEHCKSFFFSRKSYVPCPIDLNEPFSFNFVTVPVIYRDEIRGVLNLYFNVDEPFLFFPESPSNGPGFLASICSQVAMFIENRALNKHSLFYQEVNHRVKNNLQNIAALLRMQMRRLDRITPEQALSDSISRIMSIALVHETLSEGQMGLVDLGKLVGNISRAAETGGMGRPWITLDASEHPILIPSREATSVSLIVNEVVQNAIQHGFKGIENGRISIRIRQFQGWVKITVQDSGPGFPSGFDFEKDVNLGLIIVRTLATEELKGSFHIRSEGNAAVELNFPLPYGYHHKS